MKGLVTVAIILFSLHCFAKPESKSRDCHLYQRVKVGMTLKTVQRILGEGNELPVEKLTVYSWQVGLAVLNAGFENDQYSYLHYYGNGDHTIPRTFLLAKQKAHNLNELKTILGKPNRVEQRLIERYQFTLKSGTTIGVRLDNKKRVASVYAGIYCQGG